MTRPAILLGVLGAVLIVALWWLFVYSPGADELAQVQDEIAAAEAEQASLEQRIEALEAVRARAPEIEAAIALAAGVVPSEPGLPAAFRQVEAAAEDAGATIRSLAAQRPVPVEELSELHQIEVTMNVEGSYFQLVDLVRRIEDPTITARGFDFTTSSLTLDEYPTLTASLTGRLYAILDPVPTPPSDEPTDGTAAQPGADADGGGTGADTEQDAPEAEVTP